MNRLSKHAVLFAGLVALGLFVAWDVQAQLIPNRGMRAGVGNWMQIPDNPSIAIPVFTVEAWVKASSNGLIVTRDIPSGLPSDWQGYFENKNQRTTRQSPRLYQW